MSTLTGKTARILFAIPFAVFGLFHLMAGADMAGMVPPWLPAPTIWVYVTGICLILAAIAIITGWQARMASLLLALLLLSFVLFIHLPGVIGAANEAAMQGSLTNLLKDFALMAGSLMVAGRFAHEA